LETNLQHLHSPKARAADLSSRQGPRTFRVARLADSKLALARGEWSEWQLVNTLAPRAGQNMPCRNMQKSMKFLKKWIRRKLEDLSSEISEGSAAGTLPAKTKISTELGRK